MDISDSDEIYFYSNPDQVIENARVYLGDNVDIKRSNRKNKKYMVFDGDKYVYFGAMGFQDFTKHRNPEIRNRYLKRALKIKGNWKGNKYSPNNLSIHILWELP